MAKNLKSKTRRQKFGDYELPTKAINALIESGIDESSIDDYSPRELSEIDGFGKLAAKMVRLARQSFRDRQLSKPRPEFKKPRREERTEDTGYATEGRDQNFRNNHDNWLDLPTGQEKATATKRVEGDSMTITVGAEHGLMARHIQWMNNTCKNAHPDLQVGSIERLLVKLIRGAMQKDPSKGGTLGVAKIQGSGEQMDIAHDNTVQINI